MARLLSRDPGAWEELLERHGGMIAAVCRRTLMHAGLPHDPAAVSDAVAEVFHDLLAGGARVLRRFRPGASLGAYLHVIARLRTIDLARRRRPEGLPWLEAPGGPEAPVDLALEAERRGRLKEALASLPPRDAGLLRLFHLEALPYREIARRTGLPEDQIGVHLLRARRRLRESLGGDFLESL